MRVYLAAAMTSEDRDLPAIRTLLGTIEAAGHDVPTRHVADPDGRERDAVLSDAQLAGRDLAWIESCDAVVAEVSTPSHGVGIEVASAVALRIPVLLASRSGVRVSRLLLGLDGVEHVVYAAPADAAAAVREFLARVSA